MCLTFARHGPATATPSLSDTAGQKESIFQVAIVTYVKGATKAKDLCLPKDYLLLKRLPTASLQLFQKYGWLEYMRTLRGNKHIKSTHLNWYKLKDLQHYPHQI